MKHYWVLHTMVHTLTPQPLYTWGKSSLYTFCRGLSCL